MSVPAYPLQWPAGRPRKGGILGNFRHGTSGTLTVAQALTRLHGELDRLGARLPVISTNVELRRDGFPYSGQAEPRDPGVAVYFQLKGEPVCLPCDTYTKVAQNIAAVAKHIEATRAIERYGVATVSEMFSGFTALPAPKTWHEILGVRPDASAADIEAAYRREAKTAHPDRPGGSHDAMAALNKARDEGLEARRR